jgi:hypothetical protein
LSLAAAPPGTNFVGMPDKSLPIIDRTYRLVLELNQRRGRVSV